MSLRLVFRAVISTVALWTLLASTIFGQQVPTLFSVSTSHAKYAPDRMLVKFRQGVTAQAKTSIHATLGARTLKRFMAVMDLESVSVPKGMDVATALHYYHQRSEVDYAEPDYIVQAFSTPNDPLFSQMWNLYNTGQNGGIMGDDVGATLAWNLSSGSHNVVVATIDSGIDYTHPDLIPNLFHDTSVCNGVNDGSNGCYGISTVSYTSNVFDDLGHGTHVSGIIGAAGNNGIGVVGINWNVQLLSCKFMGQNGNGQTSDAISCLDYVLQMKNKGYNIVASNNSWGGTEYSQALTDAIQAQQNAGILFIAASGNEFNDNDVLPTYPANTPLPNVISVAATTRSDALAVFSNTGRHSVHLAAPGQEILSTWPNSNYEVLSGTSMATPHVTGAAALLAAQNPALDWRALKNLILTGGDSRPSLVQTVSGKRLNVNGSMTCSGNTLESRLQPMNDAIAASPGVPVTLEAANVDCSQPAGNVQVTVSPGGSTVTLVDDGTSGDQVAGDGIYTSQWTPPAVGSYTLTFPGGDAVQTEVLDNYVVSPTAYNYISITGTNLNLSDDGISQITSPFAIPFGGGSFTNLQVGANGTISFTDGFSSIFNTSIPALTPIPVTLVAPFWQDLYPVQGSAQNVYWAVVGSAPNRQLVVEWRNVRSFLCHSDSAATVTLEVVFSESSSDILFEYADTTFGDACYFQDAGSYATVGVQVSPTIGTMWSIRDPVIISGTALRWTVGNTTPPNNPVPTVTSLSPASVPINGPAFTLTVNGTGFVPTSAVNFDLYNRPTTYVSSTQLTAEIPAEAIAQNGLFSIPVWVQNPPPGGGMSGLVDLPLSTPVPTITSLSPASVTAGSFSFSLVINGTGFGDCNIYWNGTLVGGGASFSSTQLIASIPYTMITTPGTVQITVQNTGPGGGTSNAATFSILPQSQSHLFLQPPLLTHSGQDALPMTTPVPTRFLGWNYARRAGEDYTRAFARPRAQSAVPVPDPAKSMSAGTSPVAFASTGPSLAGLELRPLLPADYIPTAVATGDLNGDGIPDWVVANGGSNNLWVYLGRGDGTFTQVTVIPLAGQSPVAVALADLRSAGKLDIIVAEADSASVGVLLGNGDGTFGFERPFFVPGAPISLAVADLNHDGHPDLVAGVIPDPNIASSGAIVSLIGDGTGSFGAPIFEPYLTFGVQTPQSIAVADFEKNGKPDLVVLDPGVGAVMYVNDGTGFLKEAQPIDVFFSLAGIGPISVTSGDVNEDGCPDVITFDSLGIARVFLGNCDSTFQGQFTEIGEGDFAYAAALADVNGDGHLDLIYSGIYAQTGYGQVAGNLVGVHFGDGKGNFGPAHTFRGGQTSYGLALADFNHDGHIDIITANQDSDSASIFLNDGKGGFGFPTGEYVGYINGNNSSGSVNVTFSGFLSADIDGDGKPDLLMLEYPGGSPPSEAAVMLNDGTGHFGPAIHSSVADGSLSITDSLLADFRNSGHPDLVTISSSFGAGVNPQLVFAPNAGAGSFGTPKISNIPLGGTLAAGDFNHDGFLDLAIATVAGQSGPATITIYLGHGDGTFTAQTPITFNTSSPSHWIQGLWVGDFNGDGKLDLLAWFYLNVVPFQNNDVYELLGNGDGTFAPAKLVIQNLTNPAVADLNHDGRPDVVENVNPMLNYPNLTAVSTFEIFLCQPDGTFTLTNTYAPYSGQPGGGKTLGTPNGSRSPAWLADFNGDGNIDLAAIQQQADSPTGIAYVQFMLGNGDGTFTPTYEPYFLYASLPSNAFDLTGDGRADMVENDMYTSSFQVIPGASGTSLNLTLVADPVIGTNGTVQVSLAALSNTTTQVTLAASDPAITLPTSVTIPAGSLTENVAFTIGSGFNSSHVFWIQGTLNGSTATTYGTQATAQGQYGAALSSYWSTESTFPGLPTASYQLGVRSLAGYSTTLTLSCTGLPDGAACQFGSSSLSVVPGGSNGTSLIINTSSSTPFGVYPITVQATDGAVTSQLKITLDVGDFSVSLTPASKTVLASATATYNVTIATTNNYGGNFTGACTGLPAAAVCSVNAYLNGWTVTIQTNNLGVGTYNFTVSVSNGVASRSASAQLSIGDFNATLSANTLTVNVGESGNVTITVTSENGFTDQVTLSCNGAPTGTNCSLSPATLNPSAAGATSTLTVQVLSKPAQSHSQTRRARRNAAVYLSFAGLFGLILIVSNQPRSRLLSFAAVFVVLAMASSCGGGGGSVGGGGGGGGGGSGGGGGGGGGGSASFNLTVQASSDGVTTSVGTIQVTVP